MPKGRIGGDPGGGISTPSPGTFSATASTTSSSALGLTVGGFLTELSVRIDGDPMAGSITGGPVSIEAWLGRGSFYRKLCEGGLYNEFTVRGSGMLPVSPGDRIIVKWTNGSADAVTVRVDAFVDSEVTGEGAVGWLDETPPTEYVWLFKQVCTQDNVAGGTLQVTAIPPSGQLMILKQSKILASGNRAVYAATTDGAADISRVIAIGAAAGAYGCTPTLGQVATTSAHTIDSKDLYVTTNCYVYWQVTTPAQTETATVWIQASLSTPVAPTVSWAGSGGTPNATAAAINSIILVKKGVALK